jgi:glucose-6-phosphate-specific signal transduction histidine kinase
VTQQEELALVVISALAAAVMIGVVVVAWTASPATAWVLSFIGALVLLGAYAVLAWFAARRRRVSWTSMTARMWRDRRRQQRRERLS